MKAKLISLTFILFLFSCKDKLKYLDTNKEIKPIDSSKYINVFSLSPYLDTIDYSKLDVTFTNNYDTSELGIPDYNIDTFSQNNNKFRLIRKREDSQIDATLEKEINGQWYRRIEFYSYNGSGEIKHSIDVNNDSYKDIIRENRWFKEIYFFDKEKNNFVDTVGAILDDGVVLIDTIRNIYCDIQEFRQLEGQINSRLFTFKNLKRVNLFNLNFCNWTKDNPFIITKLILSKCYEKNRENYFDSLVNLETIKLPNPIILDKDYQPRYSYFNYVVFWKKNYKRLMGFSQHRVL